MCTDPASVGLRREGQDEMTADGVVSVVLIMIAAAVIVYLFVALLDPERF